MFGKKETQVPVGSVYRVFCKENFATSIFKGKAQVGREEKGRKYERR